MCYRWTAITVVVWVYYTHPKSVQKVPCVLHPRRSILAATRSVLAVVHSKLAEQSEEL